MTARVVARVRGRRVELPAGALPPGVEAPKRSKYGNRRTEYRGVAYDSALEARHAAELDLLQDKGIVQRWSRQPAFEVGRDEEGRPVTYRADFRVVYLGREVFLDSKGFDHERGRAKRAAVRERYGVELALVGREGVLAALARLEGGR